MVLSTVLIYGANRRCLSTDAYFTESVHLLQILTLCVKGVFNPFFVPARRGLDFYSVHSEDYCRAASLLQVPGRSSVYESVRMMPITTTATYYNVLCYRWSLVRYPVLGTRCKQVQVPEYEYEYSENAILVSCTRIAVTYTA